MPCSPGLRAAATADFGALARSCPFNSMAPVLAIADLVADRLMSMPIVTPLERLRHLSQPGRPGLTHERSPAWSLHVPPRVRPGRPGCDRCRSLRSEEHTSELQSQSNLVCRLL